MPVDTRNPHQPSFPWADLPDYKSTLDGFTSWNTKLTKALAAFQTEWATFVTKRIRQDLALHSTLAACKSPTEVTDAYTDYLTNAANDFQKEYARLAELGQTLAATSLNMAPDLQRSK